MEYSEAIDYILSFADFERSGRFQDRPDVSPMLSLLRKLQDPHLGGREQQRLTVHVAGSKGKGSVAAMIAAILTASGLRTGLYTSPHLHSYCERISIDGAPIPEERFASLIEVLKPAADALRLESDRRLVTFDLLTATAFLAFREARVDAQVLEAGLGGRLDSTNVFERNTVCVITPISLEHTAILGGTIEKIAGEKAAIIRPGSSVILAPQSHSEAVGVVKRFAREAGADLVLVNEAYRWRRLGSDLKGQRVRLEGPFGALEVSLPLLGAHQVENAATALAAIEALRLSGWAVDGEAIAQGLSAVRWPGRLEILRVTPLIIADAAHNRDSARRLREALAEYVGSGKAVFVIGVSSDKDLEGIADELAPACVHVLATEAAHARALAGEKVAAAFRSRHIPVDVMENTGKAIERAIAVRGGQQVICVVGSLFLVAEARLRLLGSGVGDWNLNMGNRR